MGAVLALLLCASPRAGADIASGPQTRTQKDYLKDKLGWLERTSVAAFEKSGKKDAPWNAVARQFVDGACRYATFQDDAPELAKLEQQVTDLSAAGCDDPVVLRWCGEVLMEKKDYPGAEETLRKALAGLEKSSYPKTNTYWASRRLGEALAKRPGMRREVDQLTTTTLEALVGATLSGDFAAGELSVAYRQFTDSLKSSNASSGGRWAAALTGLKKAPDTDPWLLKAVEGKIEIDRAWDARGGGWANSVTEEGWQGFHEHLGKARDLLTAASKLHPEWPETACMMITVTMGGVGNPGDTERAWFDRAVQAQVDYGSAYAAMMWALRPRWGGTLAEMEKLGLESLQSKRVDADVPLLYLSALGEIGKELSGEKWRALYRRPGVAERLGHMFESLLADKSRTREHDWLLAQQAVVESWCGDYEGAAKLLKELPATVDLANPPRLANPLITWYPRDFALAKAEVRAFIGPQKETLLKAEGLALEEKMDEAIPLFKQAMEAVKDDKEVYGYLRERIAFSRMGDSGAMWQGSTALQTAVGKGYTEMVTALVEKGADLDTQDPQGGQTPLLSAVATGNAEIAGLLLEKGANPNLANRTFWTPLHYAVYKKDLALVRMLVERSADPNLQNDSGYTAFGSAVRQRNLEMANLLLEHGADPNKPCYEDWSPLTSALQCRAPEVVAALVAKGADINAFVRGEWTALTFALYMEDNASARLLIEKGADVNVRNKWQWAPLHLAAYHSDAAIVQMLLDKGADKAATLGDGRTAAKVAADQNKPELVGLLGGAAEQIGITAPPAGSAKR
jgi:ankyrin repeat protein